MNHSYRYTTFAKSRSKQLRSSMTASERHLWYDFLHDHKPRFQRQRPIGPYIVDFVCYEAALVVELDGDVHGAAEQHQHDAARGRYLELHGFRVIRIRSRDVFENFEGVCAGLDRAVRDASVKGWLT
ncbi:MAG: endonuclease domain-containing protein [Veillonellaceae bacterium]|nr:endonuclease domain-containing protein [Veillonellaceae bacterium]